MTFPVLAAKAMRRPISLAPLTHHISHHTLCSAIARHTANAAKIRNSSVRKQGVAMFCAIRASMVENRTGTSGDISRASRHVVSNNAEPSASSSANSALPRHTPL
jgi:hypothetical protein